MADVVKGASGGRLKLESRSGQVTVTTRAAGVHGQRMVEEGWVVWPYGGGGRPARVAARGGARTRGQAAAVEEWHPFPHKPASSPFPQARARLRVAGQV